MKAEQYAKEVVRTLKVLPTLEENLLHISYGITTEIGELVDIYKKKLAYGKEIDLVNLKEELGDIQWYVFNGLNFLKFNINNIDEESKVNLIYFPNNEYKTKGLLLGLSFYSSELFKDLSEDEISVIKIDLLIIYKIVKLICKDYGFEMENIFDININKLKVRFPEKFTQEAALNRNLDKERKSLES